MKNNKIRTSFYLLAIVLGIPSISMAEFSPSLGLSYEYEDNIFRQEINEQSDVIYAVTPELDFRWFLGKHRLAANYMGEFAFYRDNSNEDFDNHSVNADLLLDLTPKLNVDLQANYKRAYEPRDSSGIAPGVVTSKPNRWKESRVFSEFTYGRRIAKAEFQLGLDGRELRYTNNAQEFRDRDTNTISGRFFYKVAPKTSALIEAIYRDIDYVTSVPRDLDSTENIYHLGLRWEATGKTQGEIKVGWFDKDFDSVSETDEDGLSVVGNVIWEPQTYSRLTFTALRQVNETATVDSSYTSSNLSVSWEHDFSSRVTLNANAGQGTDDYTGAREDDLTKFGVGVDYKFRPWVSFGLSYSYAERDSNVVNASYDSNVYMLTAKF